MASHQKMVRHQTLYLSIAIALLAGFLLGVGYSSYRLPAINEQQSQQTNQLAAVIEQLQTATQSNPQDGQAWVQLGHAYFDDNQFNNAIKSYQEALKILPGQVDVMTDMGIMYRRNGQPQKAIETFDAVIAMDSNHQQARFNKGVVLLSDMHNKEAALETWKELLAINPLAATPSGEMLSDLVDRMEKEGQ
ncbi:tetratricopeptide repeat protein [Desulfogranum japonicum]|uniref:tetratricopeptide repeat protein n=1 Tax=Desulfogranum japonicum TaxID=231447 RepID=UPI0004147882|nr:tetratricopeptide repeat protein [Desulfogranum japonicum]